MGNSQIIDNKNNTYSLHKQSSDIVNTTFHYKNNEYYKGDTKDGLRHGVGTYYYQNGDKYEGHWYQNRKHGKGTFFYNQTGEMYEGMFNKDKIEGVGTFYFKNGERYHGEWKDNKKHGKGILYNANGGKFIGEFKFGLKHGKGESVNNNGDVVYEEWENGQLVKLSKQVDLLQNNYHIDYFDECNANKFEKYLSRKTQKQYETKTNQMKSKYFPLEMAKMLKNKNIDKIDSIRMIQSTTSVVMEKPDVLQWRNEDVVHWLKKINCTKYIDMIEKSGIDGKKLLKCDHNNINYILGFNDKNEIGSILRNLELLKNLKMEKYEKNNNEIEENANSEEEDDNLELVDVTPTEKTIANTAPNEPEIKKETNIEEEHPKENILKELTKETKIFYSSINVNGLNYFINFDEISNEQIKVGQGGFGEVFLGEWQGKKVAIKKLTFKKVYQGDNLSKFINEINITSSLRHPNIVLYMGASIDKDNYYMITEYLPKGSLFDLIHTQKFKFDDKTKIKIAFDIAVAIKYLHSRNVVHCDLKSSNVLLDDNFNIKLGDFGLSRFLNSGKEPTHGRIGTPHWMAPEILKGGTYQFPADIFSYGMILWELITYKIPYHNIDPMKIVDLITKEKKIVKVPDEGNPVLRRIAQRCIQYEPRDRPSLDVVLEVLGKVNKENSLVDNCTEEIYEFIS